MRSSPPGKPPFHYGWVIVFAGMLCILACLGFGRFALGMLLPSMAVTLHLSYSQMGFISTANFLGYLASVLVSAHLAGRIGARRLIFLALLTVAISMFLVSRATGFLPVLFLYMITGRLIPFLNRSIGPEGWRTGWRILAGLVLLVAFVAFGLLRDGPEDKGLSPVGADETAPPAAPGPEMAEGNIYRKGIIYYLGAIYFLFGYTYVIFATFIVTTLVKERGFPERVAGNFWMWVGFLSLFSGPVFGTLSDRLSRKAGLIIVFALQAVSYLLIATRLPGIFLYLSIGLYGLVAWSIPSIMAAAMGDYVGARKAATAFGLVTFIFGLGQITGPAVAGVLAEKTGSFTSSYYMAAAFAAAAILLAVFLRKPETDPAVVQRA